ncbi:unnamed protein product [Cuscuta campestris]|uniref:Transposase (putative) gypsy type domain-containing protein n=1 Tax=Cuscuta campestris TaxID=132261 RepID=A0A484MPW1_9ASTE|nr:unnamed protein product [Cuscuta campestris]
MISAADRKKLFKSKARAESSQEQPPLPTPAPSAEHAQASKKRKELSSLAEEASLSGARSPPSCLVDCGNPAFVKVVFPLKPSFLHGDYEPRRFLQSFIPPPDRMEINSAATRDLASTLLLELGSVAMRAPELVERFKWYVAEKAKVALEEAKGLDRLRKELKGVSWKGEADPTETKTNLDFQVLLDSFLVLKSLSCHWQRAAKEPPSDPEDFATRNRVNRRSRSARTPTSRQRIKNPAKYRARCLWTRSSAGASATCRVTVRRPTPEESVFDAPPGYFAIHLKSLENGFRFPLESLVTDFFKHFDFLPCQLVPNSHRYLAGFLIRCREMGVRADLERLLTLFRVAKSSGSDGGSFAALCQRQERLFRTKKESNRTWKSTFVFVSVGAASPFRDTPLSSFRRRSKPFASSKAILDTDKLCSGGPYEPGVLVNDEALAKLGFVFHDEDEPKRQVVQSQLEEGPSVLEAPASLLRQIQIPRAPQVGSCWRRGLRARQTARTGPLILRVPRELLGGRGFAEQGESFIPPPDRMEISSAATRDLASTLLLELGSVAMRAPELVERFKWYVAEKAKGEEELRRLQEHVAGLEGKLADAEERARFAEQARIAAEEKARRLDEEAEHVIEAFQTSPAFEEAALSRMDDLLKISAQTPAGQLLLFKEGQANYSLGLHRAQEVLLERIRNGKELPKPCENPEEVDSSIYYSEDEDANGGGEDTAGN